MLRESDTRFSIFFSGPFSIPPGSLRMFTKIRGDIRNSIRNGQNSILKGPEETDSWKKPGIENLLSGTLYTSQERHESNVHATPLPPPPPPLHTLITVGLQPLKLSITDPRLIYIELNSDSWANIPQYCGCVQRTGPPLLGQEVSISTPYNGANMDQIYLKTPNPKCRLFLKIYQ